jgi:hypothetical protein
MNIPKVVEEGKKGKNKGLPTGIDTLDIAIEGIHKKTLYGIASAPKVGKSALTLFSFIVNPFLYMEKHKDVDIEWIYLSYEMDRVKNELRIASMFFDIDYGIRSFFYEGEEYDIKPSYFLGRVKKKNSDEMLPLNKDHEDILMDIYKKRIIPLFGEYDSLGRQLKPGKIKFFSTPDNPTGIYKMLMRYAEDNGKLLYEDYETYTDNKEKIKKKKLAGYIPNNPNKYTIIIVDNLRKLKKERGFTLKENIDKFIAYSVILRNLFEFTFVEIIHLNREIANVERLKFFRDKIFPSGENIKDSGNLSEEADVLMTMFNPHDEKYNLSEHFGVNLSNYPNYRSIHIVESRDTESPLHIRVNFNPTTGTYTPLILNNYGINK